MTESVQTWLEGFLRTNGGIAGSVHQNRDGELWLLASHNIPAPVLDKVARVRCGKGMAGLALERRQPVQTCNLKTDDTGQVRPLAKTVEGQAAVAMPVLGPDGAVRAVVGISFREQGELGADRVQALAAAAETLPTA